MTAIPGLLVGPLAGLIFRFPKTAAAAHKAGTFFKAHWKGTLIILGAATACVSAYIYVKHVQATSYESGFNAAQSQAKAAVERANRVVVNDNGQLAQMKQKYAALSTTRQQQVEIVTQTKIERIHDAVQATPIYSQCSITDGVFNDLKATAAAVNASISSSAN